jgi:hypothetical protein
VGVQNKLHIRAGWTPYIARQGCIINSAQVLTLISREGVSVIYLGMKSPRFFLIAELVVLGSIHFWKKHNSCTPKTLLYIAFLNEM